MLGIVCLQSSTISLFFPGPGPAHYALPTTCRYEGHDFSSTKVRRPAWSFGLRDMSTREYNRTNFCDHLRMLIVTSLGNHFNAFETFESTVVTMRRRNLPLPPPPPKFTILIFIIEACQNSFPAAWKSPGPVYYVQPPMTRRGLNSAPAYSLKHKSSRWTTTARRPTRTAPRTCSRSGRSRRPPTPWEAGHESAESTRSPHPTATPCCPCWGEARWTSATSPATRSGTAGALDLCSDVSVHAVPMAKPILVWGRVTDYIRISPCSTTIVQCLKTKHQSSARLALMMYKTSLVSLHVCGCKPPATATTRNVLFLLGALTTAVHLYKLSRFTDTWGVTTKTSPARPDLRTTAPRTTTSFSDATRSTR